MGFEGQEDSSVAKALTTQACQLEFGSSGPMKSWARSSTYGFHPSELLPGGGRWRQEDLLKLAGQLTWHTQQQEITRPCFKHDLVWQRQTLGVVL